MKSNKAKLKTDSSWEGTTMNDFTGEASNRVQRRGTWWDPENYGLYMARSSKTRLCHLLCVNSACRKFSEPQLLSLQNEDNRMFHKAPASREMRLSMIMQKHLGYGRYLIILRYYLFSWWKSYLLLLNKAFYSFIILPKSNQVNLRPVLKHILSWYCGVFESKGATPKDGLVCPFYIGGNYCP